MGKLIIALAFILIAGLLSNTYISGETNTVKSESKRIASKGITEMTKIEATP